MEIQDDTRQEPEFNLFGASTLNSNTFSQYNIFNNNVCLFLCLESVNHSVKALEHSDRFWLYIIHNNFVIA